MLQSDGSPVRQPGQVQTVVVIGHVVPECRPAPHNPTRKLRRKRCRERSAKLDMLGWAPPGEPWALASTWKTAGG